MKMFPKYILDVTLIVFLLLGNFKAISSEFSTLEGIITDPDSTTTTTSEESDEASKEKTDIKSLIMKYESDDGNRCLLDMIKDEVIWWLYPNGTLKEGTQKFAYKMYLDLSHGNLKEDSELLRRTKLERRFIRWRIEVFSAAFNTLSAAPFNTLDSMRDSLKFLSLRGNNFSDLIPDAEAFERFLNETRSDVSNTTQHRCETLLAYNATDLYDRECYLYFQNNTDTTHTALMGINYEEYVRLLLKRFEQLGNKPQFIAWASFPKLPRLVELDISNCSIEYVSKDTFRNVTSLRRLFMSDNKIMTIYHDTFYYIQGLQYLDLSFTNFLTYSYQLQLPTLEMALSLIYGLKIQQYVFKLLPELVYLDLSHSKMTRNSAVAFAHLGAKLRYLSLCYTSIPMVSSTIFKNTVLEGLDLSGNPYLSYNVIDDAFDGIADTLKYLYFEQSNLKDLEWAKSLKNLQVLGLAGNNINALTPHMFQSLESLEILDLSSNHVGNWYRSAFFNNSALKVLNLRSNTINMLSNEMLRDFERLDYLSLGENDFICDCGLRAVVELAATNNKDADCSYNLLNYSQKEVADDLLMAAESLHIDRGLWQSRYLPWLKRSYTNVKDFNRVNHIIKVRIFSEDHKISKCSSATPYHMEELGSDLSLKFQLLDYEASQYYCFNNTDQLQVDELNCQVRAMSDLAEELHRVTNTVIAVLGSIVGVCILGFIVYLKRWHIHYYYSSLKSAALLSSASKEAVDSFSQISQRDPSAVYDIFISYCQNDRPWVLNELLPNVEETRDISICLHERDFQIGVTILDNIISCMDRSYSLMLIISSKFLLSHWCQFEMYLAQHRIFEVSKEHLILVFLEDIPRRKRPKTLQYLMDVKTYIKWPAGKGDSGPKSEERKLFWKRLRRTLDAIGISSKEVKA
ncbi:LOW QUALITY PROTEIN: toll-like receptor 13 [Drosophila gunungcola]|uniref:LOW QUALITY PROTEIN: toll-like receptor 13 n=1 Tax=Drosophila gunungcola TaxID=103775 RepID=UPI0022E07983|nr:LOW QUALITY PROTEIN: toll-like receptor 13 [Drosophila gunungcola]